MDHIRLELDDLRRILESELSYERHSVRRDCDKCVNLTHELMTAQKKTQTSLERIRELEEQVRVNQKLKEENQSLRKQLIRDSDNPSFQSVVGELAIEKQRRIRAEQELEIYRKQGKTADEKVAVNARRVAITLAQHCLELSHEVQRLRNVNVKSDSPSQQTNHTEAPHSEYVTSAPSTALPNVAGWGVDDDIFDESN